MRDAPHQPYLRVRNWEKYQDKALAAKYKESGRGLPWVKQMSRRLEEDYEYAALHPLARYIWTECIGLAAIWGPNRLPWNLEWLQSKMFCHYLGEQFAVHLTELVEKNFLVPCGESTSEKPLSSINSTEPGGKSGTEPGVPKSKELRGSSSNEELLVESGERQSQKPRRRDELFDTLVETLDGNPSEWTRSERGRWNRALKELREAGAEPSEIVRRATTYRNRWPDVTLTPTALSSNWASLGTELPGEVSAEERRKRHLEALRSEGRVA